MEGGSEGRRDHSRCLVGKFVTEKKSRRVTIDEELKEDLKISWSFCRRGFDVYPLDKGLILVEFLLEKDMKNVASIGIWVAKGTVLLVKEWPSVGSVAEIDFSMFNLWVTVKGLPLSRYTQEEARRIGRRLSGKPLKEITIDPSKRRFAVRAEIDIGKPLHPGYFIDKQQRKPIFIQFKYRYAGGLCRYCGMIDHTICLERLKECPLTRNIKRPMYGIWMYDLISQPADVKLEIEFPEKLVEDWTELEETVPYPQFFINLEVAYVCASDHEWRGKRLYRYNLEDLVEHGFRFPTSYLTTALESSDDPCKVLAREMDENVPLVGLTFEDKVEIASKFIDYTMKSKEVWSGRRWVQVKVCVIKTTKMISCVDFQTMLQESNDKEYHRQLDQGIRKMIERRVENNDDIVSLELWRSCIKDVVGEDQLMPFNLEKRCIEARKEAIEYGISLCSGLEPASATEVDKLDKRKVSGDEMDELEPCAICEEGMFLGEEATRMPCSHVFHATCIESWLEIDYICPLCRHKPTKQEKPPCPRYLMTYRLLKQRYL